MTLLKVQPDTEYGIEQVLERFEVDEGTPFKVVELIGYTVAKKAIERYEALRHWQFIDLIPVVIDFSDLQVDLDQTDSPLLTLGEGAFDGGSLLQRKGKVAFVAKLHFRTQLIVKENIDAEIGRADGYINADEELYPTDIEKDL